MRVAIGKRREYKPCVQKVERTACKDCPKKGSECAECDYLAIYDGADEALRAGYYKQYRAVRDIQSERAITSVESDRSDSVGDKMKMSIKKRRNQFPLISAQDANASAHRA